tara:strand:- start:44 stop:193 length:150 start_codon:yes stop_codon:yes gene_type:complete
MHVIRTPRVSGIKKIIFIAVSFSELMVSEKIEVKPTANNTENTYEYPIR